VKIREAIFHGERILLDAGIDDARWNSERLLMLALQLDRARMYADLERELTDQEESKFSEFIKKRSTHYPLAYLEGTQEFFGREFIVNESVLIPRPETEEIVHAILKLSLPDNPRILDLGAGSGNLAVTLLLEIPEAFVVALEKSSFAIPVIQENSKGHVEIVRGDFHSLCFQPESFDIITANLPYVENEEFKSLPAETKWEPFSALQVDSLEASYDRVMTQSVSLLRSSGYLFMEIGFGQSDRLASVVSHMDGLKLLEIRNDQRSIPRVLVLRKN
jgi:release factor glutamine methyltransferase